MSESKNQTTQKRLSDIKKLGNSPQAINQIQKLLEKSPNNFNILMHLGKLERQRGRRKQALKYYQKALEIDPQNLWANLDVAIELRDLNNFEAARKKIDLALEYYPDNFNALIQMGQLEQKSQQLEIALSYFQQAIANYPERIEPHFNRIDILFDLGRLVEAQNNLEILRQRYPEEPRTVMYSGHLARKLGQRGKALQCFCLAQEKASNLADSLNAELFALEELRDLGRINEALKLIEAIIPKFPENIRAQMIKGSIFQKIPNLSAAASVYKSILATNPEHLNSRIELAKIYSQSGQVELAITLLEETYRLLGANIPVLIQLGSLYQALENWQAARQSYQEICHQHPNHHHGYCLLANLVFLQGETGAALKLLQTAQDKIPNSVYILIQLIELQLRLGNLELSHQLLINGLARFPHNIQLSWQLGRVLMEQGDYAAALDVLDQISTDNQDWIRQTEQLRGNVYFYQYDYPKAEAHFQKAISLSAIATGARNRLATIFMLTGRIDEARQEFKIATEELKLKTPPGKTAVPLKSHPAMVTNELRINPPLLAELQKAQQETGSERILKLGSLLAQEPTYLGTALYLARELRQQGIFDGIQQTLSINSTSIPAIPQRIVQFWDEPEPPEELQRICQSWIDLNPQYEYTRFSLNTAIAFLRQHYDAQVLQAFANCDQPATQADFFRLAYLNIMGGFYADADDLCRQSLDTIVSLNPELVVLQEDFACIGNNFLGCIPGQSMIRTAFHQAVNNLTDYCNEGPWFKTGPGLITSVVCSGLIPYLTYTDYQMWPRLLVLTQSQLRKFITQHIFLAYKRTNKSWQHNAYHRRIRATQF
ncbi:tetratricopeptide repeat protein [Pleurocapsa sp. PCC 7319]|uniref:tetratricopeptide repeat protein n=1 Tax=Pleurocapsa sp. PCC 7319 TaxID=118161 RepID=UPI00034C552E|nr:tetratricopeptide repeat protein [Pleurocapsa sp. PCC 7319]